MRRDRLIPLIIATGLFMENTDSTVIATALPTIAADLGQDPIALKLAMTSYLVSLAVFIPISGWTADRYGARTVFSCALGVFMAGSLACAAAGTLPGFIAARFLQGMGGAMMVPVGRLVLLRTVPKSELVNAFAWLATPALVGPVLGPPLGGLITTYLDWRWIFFINIPIGLAGIVLSTTFIDNVREGERPPLDFVGFLQSGLGLALFVFGLSSTGRHVVPLPVSIACALCGAGLLAAYVRHAGRAEHPLVDLGLLRFPTFRDGFLGGALFRVGVGAIPFLLPLLLQLGFGLDALHSGLLTFASAAGALVMKTAAIRILKAAGFRTVLVWNALVASAFLAASALFSAGTPHLVVLAVLLIGGCVRSLEFTALNAIIYADVPTARMSSATSLSSVGQQVSLSLGITIGAAVLEGAGHLRHAGAGAIAAGDFGPAFVIVALVSASSALLFRRLHPDAGAEMSGRAVVRAKPTASSS